MGAAGGQGIFGHEGFISAGPAEDGLFGIASALPGHGGEGGAHGGVEDGFLRCGQRGHLALGMDAGVEEDILQSAVAKPGDALLGGEQGFDAGCCFDGCDGNDGNCR